jgi:CRP/FNR family cyclic AMP-dependent transcriptional regulator
MHTIANLLATHPFFRSLERADLEFIAGCGRNVRISTGERIFAQGDPADAFFILRRGRVALGASMLEGNEVTLETLEGGDVLGWSWLVEPYVWHFDADAIEPVSAIAFDAVCLRTKCESNPRLGYLLTKNFAQVIARRLEATRLQSLDIYAAPGARGR